MSQIFRYETPVAYQVSGSEKNKHDRYGGLRGGAKLAVGATIILAPNAVVSANVSDQASFGWDDRVGKYMDIPVSDSKPCFVNHYTQLLGCGTPVELTVARLMSILDENRGKMMSLESRKGYEKAISNFEGIGMVDYHVIYSRVFRSVRTVVVMDEHISMSLNYDEEGDRDALAFTLDFDNETILTGIGKASDVAESTRNFLATAKLSHES